MASELHQSAAFVVAAAAWLTAALLRRRAGGGGRRPHSQRRAGKWAEAKAQRLLHRREERQQGRHKRAAARRQELARLSVEERRERIRAEEAEKLAMKERLQRAYDGDGANIAIDLSFQATMSDREVKSLARQLGYIWAANKRAARPATLHIHLPEPESVDGSPQSGRLSAQLFGSCNAAAWLVHWHRAAPTEPWEVFGRDRVVVLSPDAPDELPEHASELPDDTVFVLCGIVDRTVGKSISLEAARAGGVRCARFPLRRSPEFAAHGSTSKAVLNLNTAFELLLAWRGGAPWRDAIEATVPVRHRKGRAKARKATTERN